MRKKLPDYISGLNQTFDYAFCSGDIKEWNSDYSTAPDYLHLICNAAHTPLEHLFIVPGNHDIDRGDDYRTKLIDKITDWKTDYYSSNNGQISYEDICLLKSGQKAFIDFISTLLGTDRAEKYNDPHFVISTEHLNILHLDTTLTYGTNHERDLVIGTKSLMDVLDKCETTKPTVILTHYSFDFLSQDERDEVETLLNTYHVQLWFAGHEHKNLIRRQRDKFYECQCGNLALQKGARSCFLTGELDLDTGDGQITVHAWYSGADWELYPFARIGSEDDRIFPIKVHLPGREMAIGVSAEINNAREACDYLKSDGNLFSGVRINTDIFTDLEISGNIFSNTGDELPLTKVMNKLWKDKLKYSERSSDALILGDGGMGKSTMMYYECCRLLSNNRLAVYISLQEREGAGNESLTGYILKCIYHSEDERAKEKFNKLTLEAHSYPDLILFIDGFNELTGEGAQKYVAEIKTLSQRAGIQIIVSSRLDFLRDYGLSRFGMINTCDLRDEQIQKLFCNRYEDWNNVQAQKNLRILLRNPMMALLYASTCPIVEKHADLDYLNWIIPIMNASDLLHDYYMSQIAILIDMKAVDGNRIFECMATVDRVLPAMAYKLERNSTTVWNETDFEADLRDATEKVNSICLKDHIPENLRKIKRRLRVHKDTVGDLYDLIITEMVLLKSGNGTVSFAHQIFRDYLAAVHLHNCLMDNVSIEKLWHKELIHKGVVQYLRFIGNEATWEPEGIVSKMLEPYRGKEKSADDWLISNIINCWLSIGENERNLSNLDLRNVYLSEHLKTEFHGTINIDGAWISKETLINDRHHDRITGFAFSHDNRTMAAVSENGLVSITNLLTQSQMIVGELENGTDTQVGFDADDCLIVRIGNTTCKWPTITYDKIVTGNIKDIVVASSDFDERQQDQIASLKKRLEESGLEGTIQCVSENGCYIAVGFESGFIQVWGVDSQECIANLSLSDSQIATVAFTKNGALAALGSGGKIIQVWDMNKCQCCKIFYFKHRVSGVRFLDNRTLECKFSNDIYCKIDLKTGRRSKIERHKTKPFVSTSLLEKTEKYDIKDIQSSSNGNAIILTEKGEAYTWDEKQKKLNYCTGHMSGVTAIAMCTADDRFAASYSPERYRADRDDRNRRGLLDNQKLVRVRIVKTGQCQWRLPTKGRSITKLQFFTSNRIILAGYCTNGDILLWELINQHKYGKEIGKWNTVEIIRNNQSEPLECAFPDNKSNFISAYADGSILIRPFSNNGNSKKIFTIPGIDAGVFRWNKLNCDNQLKLMLSGYLH
jgi:WD40 repeat protein